MTDSTQRRARRKPPVSQGFPQFLAAATRPVLSTTERRDQQAMAWWDALTSTNRFAIYLAGRACLDGKEVPTTMGDDWPLASVSPQAWAALPQDMRDAINSFAVNAAKFWAQGRGAR